MVMDKALNVPRTPEKELGQDDLMKFFISHLNRIYCAKNQLVDNLPQLKSHAHFLDLRHAIDETVEVVQNQIRRMREIFILLDTFYTHESCTGLIGLLDEAFQSIGPQSDKPALRDLSILFYMQNIESIETASFKVMMLVANKMENPEVVQLLRECYDEANEDRILFKQIIDKYV